jgi:ParB family transcriptional regulator, chromosome partitioning protein
MKLDIVPVEAITLGNRFREDMGDLDSLVASITDKGLINPITVQTQHESEPFLLVAGGRRFTACVLAGLTEVPVRIYDEPLTELQLRSIELEENIQRKDLEWIEEVNLKREIHKLQIDIHGEKHSTAEDAAGWSMRDTAKLLGKSIGGISTDLKLADAVEQLPELDWGECTNKRDAMKLLNRVEETAIKAELSKRAQEVTTKTPNGNTMEARRKRLIDSYIINDFHDAATKLTPGMFNLVEVDPPYAINLGHMKRKDGVSKYDYGKTGYNEIDQENYIHFMHKTLAYCHRLMADNSWLVLWFAPEPWFEVLHDMLLDIGFKTSRMCGMWTKPSGQSMNPNTRLANAYEPFFWARKGDPALAKPGTTNVFPFTQVAAQKKTHPTERPLELIKTILSTFAFTNAKVLVPFAGSGTTMLAAQQLQMHSIGFDLSEQYRDSFIVRVMQEQNV